MKFTTGGHHSFKEEEITIKAVSENNILAKWILVNGRYQDATAAILNDLKTIKTLKRVYGECNCGYSN